MHTAPSALRPFPRLRTVLGLALLAGAALRSAGAQGSPGAVGGAAVRAEDGAPIPFALVRLLAEPQPAAPGAAAAAATSVQQRSTTESGRFHFAGVSPGAYRLQLARIGYRPVLSPVLEVRPGETLRHDIHGTTQVVRLDPVTVRAGPSCVTGAELAAAPRVATLWAEAQKGVELRRAFDRQYRYARVLRQDVRVRWRVRRPTREVEVDTAVSEPDSVAARERRRQADREAKGYGTGVGISLPRETELLDDAFLRGHCLETAVAEAGGALGLRFRPVRGRRKNVDIRGTIWVAADSYQIRRLEFEYLKGGDDAPYARSRLEYNDVAVGGSAIRLATRGDGAILRPPGATRALVKGATATFTYTYQDFRPVGAQ